MASKKLAAPMPPPALKPKIPKKKLPAPTPLLDAVARLLDIATKAPAPHRLQALTTDKLYEILVLTRLLRQFRKFHVNNSVVHVPPVGGKANLVVFALNPARADRSKYSHFDLTSFGATVAEGWISVEVETLSWSKTLGSVPGASPLGGHHELDVSVLRPGSPAFPGHDDIMAAVTCKNTGGVAKAHVREAMGLRRETALLTELQTSEAPFLVELVPAFPASPLFLVCADAKVKEFRKPVDELGVYARHIRMLE
ncbi:hypothetical protein [Rhizobacter fulvus]